MAAGDQYQEEWRRIEEIAERISSLQSRQDRLEWQSLEIRARIDSLPYETDEEGNDINEDIRNSCYSLLDSVESEISEVYRMRESAGSEAYGLAEAYGEQAGQYTQRAAHTANAGSQFRALEGFRFGASTARAGADLAGQRAAHYEDHAAMLNDLSNAAQAAAGGIFSGSSSRGIRDRGTFGGAGRGPYLSGTVETGEDSVSRHRESSEEAESGFSGYSQIAHASLSGFENSAVRAGEGRMDIFAGRADAMLAAAWGVREDDIREYRQENDLAWVRDQGMVRLVPGSVVREHGGERLYEKKYTAQKEHRELVPLSERVNTVIDDIKMGSGKNITSEYAKNLYEGIYDFSGESYGRIRKAYHNPDASQEDREKIAYIDDYIHNAPKWSGEIYRGINVSRQVADKILSGGTVDMRGPSSWSSELDVAKRFALYGTEDVQMIFVLPENKSGVSITHLAAYNGMESEVLAPSEIQYNIERFEHVKNDREDCIYVYVRE